MNSNANDYLIRGIALEGKVRAFAVRSTNMTEEMRRRHGMTPTASAALGRTTAAALMMGAMMKGDEKLTVQIKGGGPIGQIIVDANASGEARGYVSNPEVDLPLNAAGKLDVAGAVGTEGALYVIKDLGLKEPYHGSIPIVSGELAEDFTYYFAKSEQTPAAVALGVLVDVDYTIRAAGGFIVQLLPGLSDQEITDIEGQLSSLPSMTTMLDRGLNLEQILFEVVPSIQVLESSDVRFRCFCSRERIEETLITLGKEELQSIIDEDDGAEVICQFCNEPYTFNGDELKRLLHKTERN